MQTYAYDNLNRLQSATETYNGSTQSWKQTFSYDRYGNRSFDANNTTTIDPTISWKITNPLISTADNRLKKYQDNDSVADYDYDKAGNLTLDAENKRYTYNAENQQTGFFSPFNNSRTPDAVYQYDGEGRRVRKTVGGSIETIFVYNADGLLVAEYSNMLPEKPQVNYLTADHLGSPRIVTDEDGKVVSRHDYMAFGDEVSPGTANRSSADGYGMEDGIRKQYTGYERDEESGLDYAQARYYNSKHGRFTSVDPLTASATIKDPQSFNRYSYALNSPYKFTDPLGLLSQSAACGTACANNQSHLQNEGNGYWSKWAQFNVDSQTQQQPEQPEPPPPASDDGTVDPSDIDPTVFYGSDLWTVDGGPPEWVGTYSDGLSGALTQIARKVEQLKGASLQNTELALEQSRQTVEAEDTQHWEVRDLIDPFISRNCGGTTPTGYVVLPGTEGESYNGSGIQTTENVGTKAQEKANSQVAEIDRMSRPNSKERLAFINKVVGTTVTLRSQRGKPDLHVRITRNNANDLFSNAIIKGSNAAIDNHKKNKPN